MTIQEAIELIRQKQEDAMINELLYFKAENRLLMEKEYSKVQAYKEVLSILSEVLDNDNTRNI